MTSDVLTIIQSHDGGVKFSKISKQIDEPPQVIMAEIEKLIAQGEVIIVYAPQVRYIAKGVDE